MNIDKAFILLSLPFICVLAAIWVAYMCNKPGGSWLFPRVLGNDDVVADHYRMALINTILEKSDRDAPETKMLITNIQLYLMGKVSERIITAKLERAMRAEHDRRAIKEQAKSILGNIKRKRNEHQPPPAPPRPPRN